MEYIYAELIRSGKRTLASVPKTKLPYTAVLLILSGDITIEDTPEVYREKIKKLLEEQGYNEYGEIME